jgi:1,4-dihydroxy-2-naphthoate octaprenyltransferase
VVNFLPDWKVFFFAIMEDPVSINFSMWKTALWGLVKMDKKEEWDKLDVISKWLIATRSAVTTVTLYSCVIAGLLAWRDGHFNWLPWIIVTLGLFIAHGTNNFLNDYTDFSRGVDKDNYFRTQYGVHPLVQGFWTKRQQLIWFFISGVLAFASGVYALFYTNFSPVIIGLFAFGAVVLLFYTWPLKYLALGELSIFLIWGPILVVGVYSVLARGWTPDSWNVAPGGCAFRVERPQHQPGQAHRQVCPGQAKGRWHPAGQAGRESRPLSQHGSNWR